MSLDSILQYVSFQAAEAAASRSAESGTLEVGHSINYFASNLQYTKTSGTYKHIKGICSSGGQAKKVCAHVCAGKSYLRDQPFLSNALGSLILCDALPKAETKRTQIIDLDPEHLETQ